MRCCDVCRTHFLRLQPLQGLSISLIRLLAVLSVCLVGMISSLVQLFEDRHECMKIPKKDHLFGGPHVVRCRDVKLVQHTTHILELQPLQELFISSLLLLAGLSVCLVCMLSPLVQLFEDGHRCMKGRPESYPLRRIFGHRKARKRSTMPFSKARGSSGRSSHGSGAVEIIYDTGLQTK